MSNETKKQELLTVLTGMSDEEQAAVLVDLVKETLARIPRLQSTEPEEPQKHYYCSSKSMEECDEEAAAYEETPGGRIFKSRVRNALNFTLNADTKCSITSGQVGYLANKHYNSFLNGSFDLYALGFKAGADYQKRKARAKK